MNLTQCELQLQSTYEKNPNLWENISQLTNHAWGKEKSQCLQLMWGVSNVKTFVFQRQSYVAPKQAVENTHSAAPLQTSTQKVESSFWENAGIWTVFT